MQDIKKLDADQIAAKEAEELQKERRELQAKLKSQEKKVDYFERAKRLEEIPLIQVNMKEKQVQDQNFWEQQERERITAAIEERKLAVATRDRLARMKTDKEEFLSTLKQCRNIVFEDKLQEFDRRLKDEKSRRLAERKAMRQEERKVRYLKEKQEEAERKAAEQRRRVEEERERVEAIARKEREEKERVEREERERQDKEHQEMLQRVAAAQKAKDEEIERKLQEEKEKVKDNSWRKGTDKEAPKKDTGLSWRNVEKPADEQKKSEPWRRKLNDIFYWYYLM